MATPAQPRALIEARSFRDVPDPSAWAGVVTRLVMPPVAAALRRWDRRTAGVHRFVIAHVGASPDRALLGSLAGSRDREVLVAVGAADLASIAALRDAGVDGVIVGEALFTGALDIGEAVRAASG